MELEELVNVSASVAATRSRSAKRAALAECLRRSAPNEIALIVNYLSGTLPQGRIGLGPALVGELMPEPVAPAPSLALGEIDATFDHIAGLSGPGSKTARRDALGRLFARATAAERDFLIRLLLGEIRQGALEGVLIEGIAEAADISTDEIRRAVMLASDPAPVALAALSEGRAALGQFRLEPMAPLRPMLAQPAEDIESAMAALGGEAQLEYKLDGARVQIHRVGPAVRIFSRALNDVTESLPDVVAAALALPARELILDGEVIALREDRRPHPFQVTMRRFGRRRDDAALRESLPLSTFLFDIVWHDGESLLDRTLRERAAVLAEVATADVRIPQRVSDDSQDASAFLAEAFAAGHEGIMAKSLDSHYAAGNRGADWLKLKQAHSLDLVILAAEWGSGRRRGWLSNLHLGARDPETGGFVMLGKTFKGLTDQMLESQTQQLLALETARADQVVFVRPELVVEITVNDIQSSPHYPGAMALRFARVKRYRRDKSAVEADTIDTVRALFAAQTGATS